MYVNTRAEAEPIMWHGGVSPEETQHLVLIPMIEGRNVGYWNFTCKTLPQIEPNTFWNYWKHKNTIWYNGKHAVWLLMSYSLNSALAVKQNGIKLCHENYKSTRVGVALILVRDFNRLIFRADFSFLSLRTCKQPHGTMIIQIAERSLSRLASSVPIGTKTSSSTRSDDCSRSRNSLYFVYL